MSYTRVIPRDLFNESSLLKCLGRLQIILEGVAGGPHRADARLGADPDDAYSSFDVVQSSDDGSISVENLPLIVRGERLRLYRPLNSRQPWPLYVDIPENDAAPYGDTLSVFDDEGIIDQRFLDFLTGKES